MSISIRTSSGVLLDNFSDILSGTLTNDNVTYSGTFRVYNNYDGDNEIKDMNKLYVYLSAHSGINTPYLLGGLGIEDWYTTIEDVILINDMVSGVCVSSSMKNGDAPAAVIGNLNHVAGLNGDDYKLIRASGTYNYNEYSIEFTIPSEYSFSPLSGVLYVSLRYEEGAINDSSLIYTV